MDSNSYRTAIPVFTAGLVALLGAIVLLVHATPSTTSAPPTPHGDTTTAAPPAPTPEPTSIAGAILGVEPETEPTWMMFVPMARIADALRALDPLLGEPQLVDATWTAQVTLQIDAIHTADRHLWDLEFLLMEHEFYQQTLGATGWCKHAADQLEVAIKRVRHDELRRAHDLVQHCRARLKQLGGAALTTRD